MAGCGRGEFAVQVRVQAPAASATRCTKVTATHGSDTFESDATPLVADGEVTVLVALDSAEADPGGSDGRSRDFIAFFRPLVLALQTQRSELAAESLSRQALEAQIEELKALEEALNAGRQR